MCGGVTPSAAGNFTDVMLRPEYQTGAPGVKMELIRAHYSIKSQNSKFGGEGGR